MKDCKFTDKFPEESRSIISQILSHLGGGGQCILWYIQSDHIRLSLWAEYSDDCSIGVNGIQGRMSRDGHR